MNKPTNKSTKAYDNSSEIQRIKTRLAKRLIKQTKKSVDCNKTLVRLLKADTKKPQ